VTKNNIKEETKNSIRVVKLTCRQTERGGLHR